MRCEACEEDIRKGSSKIKCCNLNCEVILHQKCFSSIAKVIKLEKSDRLCKNCDEDSDTLTTTVISYSDGDVIKELAKVKSDVRLLTDLVNELKSTDKILLNKIEQITSSRFPDVQIQQNTELPVLYSQVVSKTVSNHSKSVLIITSNDQKESNSEVLNTVKANVNPAAEKISINGVKLIKNGMLISCSNEESLEKLKGVFQNKFNSKYEVTAPKPFKPRLLITDVDKSLDDRNTFLESIVQNNDYLADCDIKAPRSNSAHNRSNPHLCAYPN
ncbi:unnamed protein product [Acanthoscelides obtectus]|uniref:Uncharacterized protein n=1 Tax=Acanthoscelides obtectus TaxID=200917 RepID=A0A9P0L3B4_ACAOB|nr:unnamed protein product [Acanthoscelides obtectus]CAK1650673.1 hypothetical protein AOBTE_LOCUS16858 [Acanthoscelides obtectus]